MDDIFVLVSWLPRRKKRTVSLCVPTRMGQEVWEVEMDRTSGAGTVTRVWADLPPEALEEQDRELETLLGHTPAETDLLVRR